MRNLISIGVTQAFMKFVSRKLKKLTFILPILFVILGTLGVIYYGRGYRPDFKNNGSLKATGLLSATSDPIGAQVYINGVLKTATNNTINIDPNWYDVKISKEGYISWDKKVRVQGEIVSNTDAFLFPSNPSLSPLTTTGIINPILSPDGTKIVYIVPQTADVIATRTGLWVYDMVERPLGINRDPRQIGITEPTFDFATSKITWSPDSTQVMVDTGKSVRLYQTSKNGDFQDISATYPAIIKDWEEQRLTKEKEKLAAFKQPIIDMATSSAKIIAFSPDEKKMLYEATASATLPQVIVPPMIGTNSTEEVRNIEPKKLYVYDSKEDKNYFLLNESELLQTNPSPSPKTKTLTIGNWNLEFGNSDLTMSVYWFPTSRHLVIPQTGKIDILEYDRTNWVTVYSGPFSDGFIAPWPNGSRIIIMTNLNSKVSTLSNLYTVNLR